MDNLKIVEVSAVEAETKKTSTRPKPAHSLVVGEYDGRGFSVGFMEATGMYLPGTLNGQIDSMADLPDGKAMESAVRAYYREIQNAQVASLVTQNRKDLAAEMEKSSTGHGYVPRHNNHGVDDGLSRMEADIAREREEAAAAAAAGKGRRGRG